MIKTGLIAVFLVGTAAGAYLGVGRNDVDGGPVPAVVDVEEATPRSIEIDPPESTSEKPRQLDPAFLMSLAVSTEEAIRLAPPESCSATGVCESDAASLLGKTDPKVCPPCAKCR